MRVTFVSFYHPQEPMAAAARLHRQVSFFGEKGWQVQVICPDSQGYEKNPSHNTSPLIRFLRRLLLAWKLGFRASQTESDVFFVSAPPLSMMIAAIWLLYFGNSKPVFFEERDLLSLNPILSFRRLRTSALIRAIERWLLKKVDAVVLTTPIAQKKIEENWPEITKQNNFEIIANGYSRKEIPESFAFQYPRNSGPIKIVHVGNFYGTRDPSPLLEALQLLTSRISAPELMERLHFRFIGTFSSIDREKEFVSEAASANLEKLFHFVGRVSREEALQEIAQSDITLLVTHREGSDYAIPAKFYEYIAVGKPILAITADDAVANPIRTRRLGWTIEHASTANLATTLEWIMNHPEEVRSARLDPLVIREFDSDFQLSRLQTLFERCVRK